MKSSVSWRVTAPLRWLRPRSFKKPDPTPGGISLTSTNGVPQQVKDALGAINPTFRPKCCSLHHNIDF